MSNDPRISRATFNEGMRWLTGGGDLLARGGGVMLRAAAWLILVSLLQMVPLIGVPLLVLISPVLTGGMLGLFRRLDAGTPAQAEQVFDGFRDPAIRTRLLTLGGLLLAGFFGAVLVLGAWLSPQMDMQALSALMNDPQAMESEPDRLFALFEGVNLFGGLALAAALVALVLGALYFAVPLVFFWNWPVLAAVLWSLRALFANWVAFLGFGLISIGLMIALGFVFLLTAGVLSLALGSLGDLVGQVLSVAVSMFVQLLFAAAQWRAFHQVFPAAPPAGPGPGDEAEPRDGPTLDA